ncbi:MAG: hypothetical protein IJ736_00930 [Firmicutes bacterium]|nr:hypothetical protein [Bacillota bacterium]
MYIKFFIETDDPEISKEIAYNKLNILNAGNIILEENKKYWKIESLYEVEFLIKEKIEDVYFHNFLDNIAYNWSNGDPRVYIASDTSNSCKIKEDNEKIRRCEYSENPKR